MHADYKIRELNGADINQAYALVQAVYGETEPTDWTDYAQYQTAKAGKTEAPKGIVTLENPQGYLSALFCYRVRRRTLGGPSLDCDHFILPELLRADRLFATLLDEAEELARRFDCRLLTVALPHARWHRQKSSALLSAALEDHGYRPDRLVIRKIIDLS